MTDTEGWVALFVVSCVTIFVAQILRVTVSHFVAGAITGLGMGACFWVGRKVEK